MTLESLQAAFAPETADTSLQGLAKRLEEVISAPWKKSFCFCFFSFSVTGERLSLVRGEQHRKNKDTYDSNIFNFI